MPLTRSQPRHTRAREKGIKVKSALKSNFFLNNNFYNFKGVFEPVTRWYVLTDDISSARR